MKVATRYGRSAVVLLVPVLLLSAAVWLSGLVVADPPEEPDADPVPAKSDDDGDKPRAQPVPQPKSTLFKEREKLEESIEVEFERFRRERGRKGTFAVNVRVKNVTEEPFEGPLNLVITGSTFGELTVLDAPMIAKNGDPMFPVIEEGKSLSNRARRGKTLVVRFRVDEEEEPDDESLETAKLDHRLTREGLALAEKAPETKLAKGRGRGLKNRRMPIASDDPDLQKAMETKKEKEKDIMSIPGVVGFGTSYDPETNDIIYVVDITRLGPKKDLPEDIDGVPVETRLTWGYGYEAPEDPNNRGTAVPIVNAGGCPTLPTCDPNTLRGSLFTRPFPVGVEIANINSAGVGTAGGLATDGTLNYVVSNDHVIGRDNQSALNETIVQPGFPILANRVGGFTRFVTINFNGAGNLVDAAIAQLDSLPAGGPVMTFITPCEGYGAVGNVVRDPALGEDVKKYGRTTGLTFGTITIIDLTANIGGTTFEQQIQVAPRSPSTDWSLGGDSGSFIVADDGFHSPVGLHAFGDNPGPNGGGGWMTNVVNALGITIIGVPPRCPVDPPTP